MPQKVFEIGKIYKPHDVPNTWMYRNFQKQVKMELINYNALKLQHFLNHQ